MLQTRTVEPRTLELLKELMQAEYLASFNLVGGTALALQIGHRKSIDLDFFTTEKFDPNLLLKQIPERYSLEVNGQTDTMLVCAIDGIKVDFVWRAYPILFPIETVEGVRMLSMKDIAPMKLKAIVQRGSKKDFYDLYFMFQYISLEDILQLFQQKFQQYELFHVIKSLSYFEDAEGYADPIVFDTSITWRAVKVEIVKAVRKL